MDAFENFIYSYGAARDLLARAHRTGSLIEGLVLYVSLIDGLLRIALVLDKQLEDASGDVDFSYIQQEPGGRRYSEKEIYEQAHRRGIITTDMKAKIVDLYERRNAVIHRFFLTDIKEIYEQAHRRGIITTDMKAKIVDLYERRNAVIHRFFLTDIKYVDLVVWVSGFV